jgi:poly(3-hydroxybutyrate) depolymerase
MPSEVGAMLFNHPDSRGRYAAMGRTIAGLAAVVILFGCGESNQSVPAPRQLDAAPPLTIGTEFQRPAAVVLPGDYSIQRSYPLVILLHGFGATADLQDFIFHLKLHTTPDQFILVLPNGTLDSNGERFWDATPECCNFSGAPVDDVGYLASLMREAM